MSDEMDFEFMDMIKAARANKEYLSFIDLEPSKRITVTIEKVIKKTNVTSIGGRVEKEVYFLKVKGGEKLIWMSLGKMKSCGDLLGTILAAWIGKKIVLFADPNVKMKGQKVGGIVIEKAGL